MTWVYKWISADGERWCSDYQFASYEEAKRNAIWNARINRRRKYVLRPLEPQQIVAVWRSMKRAGWKITKRKNE